MECENIRHKNIVKGKKYFYLLFIFLRYLTFKWIFFFRMPESPGEVPEYPLFVTVGDWLDSIKMGQYKNNFMAAGFTTFDLISRMSIE